MAAAATPLPSPSAAPTATAVPDVLPHDLYFIDRDGSGVLQIFRLDKDGQTRAADHL